MDVKNSCNPDTCQYHALTEAVVEDLKEAVHRLMEGQDQMKETVIKLAEAFKYMERLDARLDKMEDLQRDKDKDQDRKIDDLRVFMYKLMGGSAATVLVLGSLIRLLMGKV